MGRYAAYILLGVISAASPSAAKAPSVAPPSAACKGTQDCEVKWDRALVWATTHTGYRVAKNTRNVIQTTRPVKYSTVPGVSIVKSRNADGSYSFTLQSFCANVFGCRPDLDQLRTDFARFVETGS
jgi:hypothetical protein